MRNIQKQKNHTLREVYSIIVLIILLFMRIFEYQLSNWIYGGKIPDNILYWNGTIIYTLLLSILLVNNENLQNLNVDKSFMFIMIVAGLLLSIYYIPPGWGIFVGLALILIFWALWNNQFDFGNQVSKNWSKNVFLMSIGLLPILYVYLGSIIFQFNIFLNMQSFNYALNNANLHSVVIEELLFRGMLWSFLKNLGMTDTKVVFVQAILFWIAHLRFINSFFTFWVALPLVSLIFGLLVKRTKSLTQSTITHLIYNFSIGIISYLP